MAKSILSFSLLLTVLVLWAAPAFGQAPPGQAPPPTLFGNTTASAGTMVASVMETVGYYAQARVLAQMSEMIGWAAALIYLCVLVGVLLTMAMHGQYKSALWMLIGPPLFIYASGVEMNGFSNRIAGSGAEWRFGAFADTFGERERLLNDGANVGQPGQVSYLFHQYNVLISEGIQRLIRVATQDNISKQMIFMARQRTLEDLFGGNIRDPRIQSLLAYFMVHCDTEIGDARLVALGNRDEVFRESPEYTAARTRYCDRFPRADKAFLPGPWMEFVRDLGGGDLDDSQDIDQGEWEETRMAGPQLVSCKQMWTWVREGSRREALRVAETAALTNFPGVSWNLFGAQLFNMVINEVFRKVTSPDRIPDRRQGLGDICPEASSDDGAAPSDATGQDFDALMRIVSALYMRRSMVSNPSQEMLRRVMVGHDGITPHEGLPNEVVSNPRTKMDMIRRQKAQDFAEARRYEAFVLLQLLPYMQGFILYGLAVVYPFFCLMILLPGQAGAFFAWMAMWAWAKSWDVGWALVMVADQILWELLPKSAFFNPQNEAPYASPISLLEGAFDGDPSYNIGTYWLMVSMMISGVPLVSAQAVLGAKKAMAGTLIAGLESVAKNLGENAFNYVAGEQTARGTQLEGQTRARGVWLRSMDRFDQIARGNLTVQADTRGGPVQRTFAGVAAQQAATRDIWNFETILGDTVRTRIMGREGDNAEQRSANQAAMLESITSNRNWMDFHVGNAAMRASEMGPGWLRQQMFAPEMAANGQPGGTPSPALAAMFREQRGMRLAAQIYGLDPDNPTAWTADPAVNRQLHDGMMWSNYRMALAGEREINAEVLMMASIPLAGLRSGIYTPVAGLRTLADGYHGAGVQGNAALGERRAMFEYQARLQDIYTNVTAQEAYHDPRFLMATYGAAYASQDRGGEYFNVFQSGLYPHRIDARFQQAHLHAQSQSMYYQGYADGAWTNWWTRGMVDSFIPRADLMRGR